jgi:hypothetical protein
VEDDLLTKFEHGLIGLVCLSVVRGEHDWLFEFSAGASLAIPVPWRIVSEGRILFTDEDHGQLFGLQKPVDGEAIANETLRGQTILRASVDRETGDLALLFRKDLRLDAFNNSSGYEGWTAGCNIDGDHRQVIALGGGDVAFM